jgi:hypothetical protein
MARLTKVVRLARSSPMKVGTMGAQKFRLNTKQDVGMERQDRTRASARQVSLAALSFLAVPKFHTRPETTYPVTFPSLHNCQGSNEAGEKSYSFQLRR